jgi:hypothetical protein
MRGGDSSPHRAGRQNKSVVPAAPFPKELKSALIETAENLADELLKSIANSPGIYLIEKIPLFGLVIASYKTQKSWRDRKLVKRLNEFIDHLGEINEESARNKLIKIFQEEGSAEILLDTLDQIEYGNKTKILAVITKKWAEEELAIKDSFELIHAVKELSNPELSKFKDQKLSRYLGEKCTNLSLTTRHSLVGTWSGGDMVDFPLTQLGQKLLAILSDVDK